MPRSRSLALLIVVLLVMGCVVGIVGATTYSSNILPTMASNTSPSPYFVNESAWYTAGDFSGYRAFDGSTATRYVPPPNHAGWVSIYLPTAPIVANYSIWADTLYNPVNWTFQASNDRSTWTTLDTKSSVAPWNLWASYPISNTQKYTYYRINVTNFTASAGSIYEVRMYTDTDYLYPYFTTNITYANPPVAVQFTDTSVGSPVLWNWSFGDGTYSNLQNPSHTYTAWGVYNTSLQVSNATTNSTRSANTTLYFQKSVVTIGDSIARGTEEVGRIWDPFGIGLIWNPSYSPPTPYGNGSYESEMQRNYTALSLWDWRYNMGWGGDTSTKLVTRWNRDALAATNATVPGDILPPTTIDNKTPSLILLQIGINDIPAVPLATTEANIMSVVTSANSHGIPIIVMSVFPDVSKNTNGTLLNAWEQATFSHNASMPNVRWVDAYSFLLESGLAIPTMTSNITPSPFAATASKTYTGGGFDVYQPWRAFDSNISTRWTPGSDSPAWIQIYDPTATKVLNYTMYSATVYSPKNWTFEGSNDNATFTVLDTQINYTAWDGWANFAAINTTAYNYYRVNVSAFAPGYGGIYEIKLNTVAGQIQPEYRYYLDAPATIHLNNSGYVDLTRKIYTENADIFEGLYSQFTPYGPISTMYPFGVAFTDTSTGSPTAWNWSFGDGTFSTDQNPYHFWWAPGIYNVSLNASTSTAYSVNYTTVQSMRWWGF